MSEAERRRRVVREGYDLVSEAYRDDLGRSFHACSGDVSRYAGWIDELAVHVGPGDRVLDLGCGNGLPGSRLLVEHQFEVTGIDFSQTQITRARRLVPEATFVKHDFVTWKGPTDPFDAIVSFYALIHVPVSDQRKLFPRVAEWLKPGGLFLATIGATAWTGVEEYLGAPMFWDHRDRSTTIGWISAAGLEPLWDRFVPEGDGGHTLVLARKRAS